MTVLANPHKIRHARVAELADALDLGSSGLNRRGSNPLSRILGYNHKRLAEDFANTAAFPSWENLTLL